MQAATKQSIILATLFSVAAGSFHPRLLASTYAPNQQQPNTGFHPQLSASGAYSPPPAARSGASLASAASSQTTQWTVAGVNLQLWDNVLKKHVKKGAQLGVPIK